MSVKRMTKVVIPLLITMSYWGCSDSSNRLDIDVTKLSETGLKGKKIFENKDCSKCHSLGKEVITVVRQQKMVVVPDLSNPFIANESEFVENHLQLVKETDMPAVELTEEEIHLVSRFVAELHAATHGSVAAENADTKCPVCGAAVSTAGAKETGLWFTYFDATYYFECDACKEAFKQAPAAFEKKSR